MLKKRRVLLTLLLAVLIAKASSDSVSLLELMTLRQNVTVCRGEVLDNILALTLLDSVEREFDKLGLLVTDVGTLDSRAETWAKEMLSVVEYTYDKDPCRVYMFLCKTSGYIAYQAADPIGSELFGRSPVQRVVVRCANPAIVDWAVLEQTFWDCIDALNHRYKED